MRSFFITDDGDLVEGTTKEPLIASGLMDNVEDPASYCIMNLGYAQYIENRNGLAIRCRPNKLGPNAIARLMFLLGDASGQRVALSHFDGDWHYEIFKSCDLAMERIIDLACKVAVAGRDAIFSQNIDANDSVGGTKLEDLRRRWKSNVTWREFGELIEDASVYSDGRYVLFEYDSDAGSFRCRDFGAEVPTWARMSLNLGRGKAIEDVGDTQFGQACARAYHQTLETFQPRLEAMDADILWPKFGMRRSRYWRLTLPLIDPGKRLWLLSASLPDTGIDLRGEVGGEGLHVVQ